MSGVNGNVIMSVYGDDNTDDEGREAARDNTKSVSRGADGGGGGDGVLAPAPASFITMPSVLCYNTVILPLI